MLVSGRVDSLVFHRKVDAISVATPPGSHLEVAREVARHGKACYLEKPMARNLTDSWWIFAMSGDVQRVEM